jgi:hypothetical protein
MIEVMMRIWASDHVRGNRKLWRQFKRKSSGLPKLELVFADYEGRGQAIPWDGMRKGSWLYRKPWQIGEDFIVQGLEGTFRAIWISHCTKILGTLDMERA